MKDKIKVGWNKVKAFWVTNWDEIIESVISENQEKKTEIEEKIERERKAIKIPLIMGVVYVVIGATLLWYLKRYNLSLVNSQDVIIGTVMFLLQ